MKIRLENKAVLSGLNQVSCFLGNDQVKVFVSTVISITSPMSEAVHRLETKLLSHVNETSGMSEMLHSYRCSSKHETSHSL